MRVRLIKQKYLNGKLFLTGEEVDVAESQGEAMIARGRAEDLSPPDYGVMSYRELQSEAKKRGINARVTRNELIGALEG